MGLQVTAEGVGLGPQKLSTDGKKRHGSILLKGEQEYSMQEGKIRFE